jgi:uncharacterized MAPEG superfamily protein
MTTDLLMLAYVAGMTLLFWLPYTLGRAMHFGIPALILNRIDGKDEPAWIGRAKRAHYNAIENLVPFAALVLTAHVTGSNNAATAASATVYFWARLAHFVLMTFAIPTTRTIAFTIGWLACLCIFWNIIT